VKRSFDRIAYAVCVLGLFVGIMLASAFGITNGVRDIGRTELCLLGVFVPVAVIMENLWKLTDELDDAIKQSGRIALDRLRYSRNTRSSRMALLAILFDVLYFVTMYRSNAGRYYKSLIGASIIYNLIFLLSAFLSEENIKNRKPRFDWVIMVLGLLQFGRILIYPVKASSESVMGDTQLMYVLVYLTLSGICCLWAGLTSRRENKKLKGYLELIAKEELEGRV